MPTFVLRVRNTREVLGRVVPLLHRRVVNVESLTVWIRDASPLSARITTNWDPGALEVNCRLSANYEQGERVGQHRWTRPWIVGRRSGGRAVFRGDGIDGVG
jgi:hypothetical protein